MLTSDLVRIQLRGGVVRPGWLDPASDKLLATAKQLISIVCAHEGATRGELDAALHTETSQGRDFRVRRGLAKLLLDRTRIEVAAALEPRTVRETVFSLATAHHPVPASKRAEVLQAAAAALDTTPEAIESALFADLAANQRVGALKAIGPEPLLHRYNVALAQAVVLRSRWLKITLAEPSTKRLRQLLRYLKFYRLLYSVAQQEDGAWVFRVDGPVSVIKRSSRYGLQLANFLPALLMCERWSLEADYQKRKGGAQGTFRLTPDAGLVSHYRDTGTWVADEERALAARIGQLAEGWTVSEDAHLVDLDGRGALVPDLVLTEPETGTQVFVEVLWRWRAGTLKRRWELLRGAGPANLILAVCSGASEDELPALAGPVHTFKRVPNARSLWKLARQIAAAASPTPSATP